LQQIVDIKLSTIPLKDFLISGVLDYFKITHLLSFIKNILNKNSY